MESEISGLADLHAYMKYENYVTCFSFPYLDLPVVATDFDRRDTPEDKLPYDPKNVGVDKLRSPLELKPDPKTPALLQRKSQRTVTEEQQEESAIGADDNRQLSLNLRG
jgi:hypothetical protein